MSWLSNKLRLLKNMRYLETQGGELTNILNFNLLENGKCLREQMEIYYRKEIDAIGVEKLESHEVLENFHDLNVRLHFVYGIEFRNGVQFLRNSTKNRCLIKKPSNSSLLITDRVFNKASGLAELYKLQRQCKIWWMRYSADPSRYYLEPFEMDDKKIRNAQSINIKSRLPIGDVEVEHITLVPLDEVSFQNEEDFHIYDERTKKYELPAVIRSVINLDVAACALIFDAATNTKRENTLFLNRKIAPFQCLVTSIEKDATLNDLRDHMSNVLNSAGLRLLNDRDHFKNMSEISNELSLADNLGIPYVLLVNSNSLTSGLLELRSRDTTLNETIHISDIPAYLLSIFQAN